MTKNEAREHILSVVDTVTGAFNDPRLLERRTDASADIEFSELELDSLVALEFCMVIEDQTGVEIDLGDLASCGSVNGLAELVVSRSPR